MLPHGLFSDHILAWAYPDIVQERRHMWFVTEHEHRTRVSHTMSHTALQPIVHCHSLVVESDTVKTITSRLTDREIAAFDETG